METTHTPNIPSLTAGSWVCSILPKRMRRVVTLVSLYGFIASDTFDETIVIEALNSELSLCSSKDALRLPARFAKHLRETSYDQPAPVIPHDRGAIFRMAVSIVNQIPPRMRYGSLVEMQVDVVRVLKLAL